MLLQRIVAIAKATYARAAHKASLKRKAYHFQARYVPITGTQRHCHIHPSNVAVAWELNTQDKSYRRPVCSGCAG